jgi:hypothetical protein
LKNVVDENERPITPNPVIVWLYWVDTDIVEISVSDEAKEA